MSFSLPNYVLACALFSSGSLLLVSRSASATDGTNPDALYDEAQRQREPARREQLLRAAVHALEKRGRAPVSLSAPAWEVLSFYHGPVPEGTPASERGRLFIGDSERAQFLAVDAATGREMFRLPPMQPHSEVQLSPDHRFILVVESRKGSDKVIRKVTNLRTFASVTIDEDASSTTFDARSKQLAWFVPPNIITVLELDTQSRRQIRLHPSLPRIEPETELNVWELRFAPDSKSIACFVKTDEEPHLVWINVTSGGVLLDTAAEPNRNVAFAFSHDSRSIAWSRNWSAHAIETLEISKKMRKRYETKFDVSSFAWSPNDQLLAVGGSQGEVGTINCASSVLRTLKPATVHGPDYEPTVGSSTEEVQFSPDGSLLAYSIGVTTQLIDVRNGVEARWPGDFAEPPDGVAFSFAPPASGAKVYHEGIPPSSVRWSPRGGILDSVGVAGTSRKTIDWPSRRVLWQRGYSRSLPLSDDERWLMVEEKLQDARTGELLPCPRLGAAAPWVNDFLFGHDGTLYVSANFGRGTELCRVSKQRAVRCEWGNGWENAVLGVPNLFYASFPNGYPPRTEIVTSEGKTLFKELGDAKILRAASTGQLVALVQGDSTANGRGLRVQRLDSSGKPAGPPLEISDGGTPALDASGRLLAVSGRKSTHNSLRVWNVFEGRQLFEVPTAPGAENRGSSSVFPPEIAVSFAANGSRIALGDAEGVHWLDSATGRELARISTEAQERVVTANGHSLVLTAVIVAEDPRAGSQTTKRSLIRVYDLHNDRPRKIQELIVPEAMHVAFAPDASGWLASTTGGLLWISLRNLVSALIQLLPTGIIARWNDGTVEVSPGAQPWLMCHSGSWALPFDACVERWTVRSHRPAKNGTTHSLPF